MMVVDVQIGATFKPGTPRLLFEMPFPERNPGDPDRYAVSPDAKRFLVTTTVQSEGTAAVAPFQVILNWPELVTAKTTGR